jgi:type II secretory pathway component PulC
MEMTLTFPDEMAQQLQILSNPSEFVTQVVKEALNKQVLQQTNPFLDSKSSNKWTRIAQRIANDPNHLAGYSKQLKTDMKEFRDNFEFSHNKFKE